MYFVLFHQVTEVTILEFVIILGVDLLPIFIVLLLLFEIMRSCSWCLCFVVESNYLLTRWL